MCKFIELLQGSNSLYGYCQTEGKSLNEAAASTGADSIPESDSMIHETLYSLLLSIFPSILHKFKRSDIGGPINYSDKNMTILATTLMALRNHAGYNIPQV